MHTVKILITAFIFLSIPAMAQENPYPLSQHQLEELFQENKKITDQFAGENGYSRKKLSSMSKKNREAFMTAKAKQLVLIYGSAYFREYREPVIEETISGDEEDYGEKRYKVKFPYNPSKEKLWGDYAAVVTFLNNGRARSINFGGHSLGIVNPKLEHYKNSEIMEMKYQPATSPKFNLQAQTDSLIQENRKKRDIQLKKEKARDKIFLKSYDAKIGDYENKPVKTIPPAQRNNILIAMARKLILRIRREPSSYHGFHETPEIKHVELNENNFPAMISKNFGKMAYRVSFYQDSDKKDIDYIVYILEETGQKYLLNKNDWLELQQ